MLDQALAAMRHHDYSAAMTLALSRLAEAPDDPDAHHVLGLARRGMGQYEQALTSLERACELVPEHPAYNLSRAAVLLTREDLSEARRALDRTVEVNPNVHLAYIVLAHMALASGDLDEAERQVKLARLVDPEHPRLLIVEGNLGAARGDTARSLSLLNRALQRAPEDAQAQTALGLAYLAEGHAAFAAELLRKAAARPSSPHSVRKALVSALLKQGHVHEALIEQDLLIERRPDDLSARLLRAELYLGLDRRDEALDDCRETCRRTNEPGKTLGMVLAMLVGRGERALARELLESLLKESPRDDLLWHARLELDQADPAARGAVVRRWSAAMPESRQALEAEARLAEVEGDLSKARELAERACADEGAHPAAEAILLRAQLRDAPDQALARAERLLGLADSGRSRRPILLWAGLALDRLARYSEAVASWSEMLRYPAPGFPLPATGRAAPPVPADAGPSPRLLWTLPGARADAALAVLSGLPCIVTTDHFGAVQRTDGLGVMAAVDEAGRPAAVLPTWRRLVAERGWHPDRVLEWIPHWDAALASNLPGSRLLALIHDPRDLLVNMCVHGSPHSYRFDGFGAAADWLAQVLTVLVERIEADDPAVLSIRGERLIAEPRATIAAAAEFLGIPVPEDIDPDVPAPLGLGELPYAFPDGHWRHYAEALAGPFETLAPLAERLGYRADDR